MRLFSALIFGLIFFLATGLVQAQTELTRAELRQANLKSILQNIERLESELERNQRELVSPTAQGRTEKLVENIKELSFRIEGLRDSFVEVATGVDTSALRSAEETPEVVWTKELKDLMQPLVNEVRRLTSRPREVDRMRTDLEELNTQLVVIDTALRNLNEIRSSIVDTQIADYVSNIENDWSNKKENLKTQIRIAEDKLRRKVGERQTFGESVKNIFQLFFKSRGLNLAIALFCAVLFWSLFRRLFSVAQRLVAKRRAGLYARLFLILNIVTSIIGAIIVFMMVLYFVEDWVLLILTLMILVGIIWTSKQAIYQFWTHATTLLNFGSVREGERVYYHGLPWLVRSVNLYSQFYNPMLHGAEVRLPLKDLTELRSRDCAPDEPWFPTAQGDWVLMADKNVGQIILQTADFVKLRHLGGSESWFGTEEFMKGKPTVISNGFRHHVTFGIDYKHQNEATSVVCEKLKTYLFDKLSSAGYGDKIIKLDVQFEEASASSLNLAAIVDFSGKAAGEYARLRRLINSICVDACTANGWIIPFTQMTVHLPKN